MTPNPHPKIYSTRPTVVLVAAWLAIVLLAVTVAVAVCAWNSKDPTFLYILGAIWAVAPPVWFWYEYFYVYRSSGDPSGFEQFKYGQQVAIAIWAGVALTLFGYVSSERFKPAKETAVQSDTAAPESQSQKTR